jgi:hypothetical protein
MAYGESVRTDVTAIQTAIGTPVNTSLSNDLRAVQVNTILRWDVDAASHIFKSAINATGTVTYSVNNSVRLFVTANADYAKIMLNNSAGGIVCFQLSNANFSNYNLQFQMTFWTHADNDDAKTIFGFINADTDTRANNEVAGVCFTNSVPFFVTKTGGVEEATDISAYTMTSGVIVHANYIIRYDRTNACWKCFVNGVLAATHSVKVPTACVRPALILYGDGAADVDADICNISGWVVV